MAYLGNLFDAIPTLIFGLLNVFLVLAVLIGLTHVLVTKLAPWLDGKFDSNTKELDEATLNKVISEAVSQATGGAGVPAKITKV